MILFIHSNLSTFVENDLQILRKRSRVKTFHYHQGHRFFIHLKSQAGLLFWLFCNIWRSDLLFCWFADYHSFLPAVFAKLFHRSFILVLGGYDVIHLPELNYGSLHSPLRKYCTLFSIRNASVNLAVSHFIEEEAKKLVPAAHIETVYNGVNTRLFSKSSGKKTDQILTVGLGRTNQRVRLKGIDYFCEVARHLPQYRFLMIGFDRQVVSDLVEIPPNVTVLADVPYEQLPEYYQRARVYCQFSRVESFGMAIAEAMLCECVPVVLKKGAMAEIVGEAGYVVDQEIDAATGAIGAAMRNETAGSLGRKRILENFSLEIRQEKLTDLLESQIFNSGH